MFEIFNFIRKKRLTHEQLRALQLVSQQVVLSLEGSVRLPGATKKALAFKLVGLRNGSALELTRDLGFVAPDSLVDVAIEASVKLLKALDSESLPPLPRSAPVSGLRLDISGRPATGSNTIKGLSL